MKAVEYLINIIDQRDWINYTTEERLEVFEKAKEMEKQQIIYATLYGFRKDAESFDWKGDNFNAEKYYNEKFKNK